MENYRRNYGDRHYWNDDYNPRETSGGRGFEGRSSQAWMNDFEMFARRKPETRYSNRQHRENYNERDWDRDRGYRYGLGDTSQGSGNYGRPDDENTRNFSHGTGNLGRTYASSNYEDNYGNDRYGRYTDSMRDRDYDYDRDKYDNYFGRREEERDWWDRTADEVASWFGDDDAERRRRMDKMGPHSGKGPKGYVRTDARIKEDIEDRLYHHSFIDATEIEVSVKDGDVTLTGAVSDKYTRRRVEDIVDDVSGVRDVDNNLKISRTTTGNVWNKKESNTNSKLDQSKDVVRHKSNSVQ